MKCNAVRWLAITLIAEIGLLHLLTAQSEYREAAYMGYLFVANFLGALVAATGVYFNRKWGWALGLVIAAGAIAGYIWSRTLGMPGMEAEEWFTPFGLAAMAVEGLYILLLLSRPWNILASQESPRRARLQFGWLALALAIMAVTSVSVYLWDTATSGAAQDPMGPMPAAVAPRTPATCAARNRDALSHQCVWSASSHHTNVTARPARQVSKTIT